MANTAGWSERLTALNDALADLYPTVDESRRLVTLARLPARSIKFSDAAVINWFNILEEARRRGRVQALATAALVDFPDHEVLSAAVDVSPVSAGRGGETVTIASTLGEAGDLSYEPALRVTQIAASIHNLLTLAESPLVTCRVRNGGRTTRHVRMRARIERLSDPAVDLVPLAAGAAHEFRLLPRLIPEQIAAISDTTRATVTTAIDVDEKPVYERGSDIWVLPRGVAPLDQRDPTSGELKDMTPYMGAFVTPRKQEVTNLLAGIAARLPDGVSLNGYKGTDYSVKAQVTAIFETLKELKLAYVNAVLAHSPDAAWLNQLVQLPRETLASRRANCVEGMVLMASLMEAVGLNPALTFVPGHAFVAWETWPDNGTWHYLETVDLQDKTFEEAYAAGGRTADAFQRRSTGNPRMFRRWDMRTLRARGIAPLE